MLNVMGVMHGGRGGIQWEYSIVASTLLTMGCLIFKTHTAVQLFSLETIVFIEA